MDPLKLLKKVGGCEGGKLIYKAAKIAMQVANVMRKDRKLKPATKQLMQPFFPKLNLNKVTFHINCTLVPNWFTTTNKIRGMTFGYTIYFKGSGIQKTKAGLRLLMHELVHVDQVRRCDDDEDKFACKYGKGFLDGGSYEKNPMEVEARDFVQNHPI